MKKFKLPTKPVKIGHHRYKVTVLPEDPSNSIYGDIDRDQDVIRVLPDMSSARLAETLLHEIFHAMYDNAGLRADPGGRAVEETMVYNMSLAMARFLGDNPELAKQFITEFSKK